MTAGGYQYRLLGERCYAVYNQVKKIMVANSFENLVVP
jgi:hypothetical protein